MFTTAIVDLPGAQKSEGGRGMSGKILVIDDEESIRFTFKRFLGDAGHTVTIATNRSEALDQLNKTDFDVIFADIILEDGTGIDILREIRLRSLSCPVIMITGDPAVATATESIRLGAFDYIPKPINQRALLHAARTALSFKIVHEEKEKYRTNLEAIFRSVRDAIITVDKDGVVIQMNDTAIIPSVNAPAARNTVLRTITADGVRI